MKQFDIDAYIPVYAIPLVARVGVVKIDYELPVYFS